MSGRGAGAGVPLEPRSPSGSRRARLLAPPRASTPGAWALAAQEHGVERSNRQLAEAIVAAVAAELQQAGRVWTLALVSGVPGLTPRIVPVAEEVTVLRVGPALHLLLHAAPAPRCVLALRTARAALLAARPVPMVRVGAASASASPTRAVLDLAAQSLALASQRPDGFGPVLGCADPGG